MDAIQAARDLGKAIQTDERYLRIRKAQERSDSDTELQKAIEGFNQLRAELNGEIQKEDKDTERIKEMDADLKAMYRDIFDNANMQEFTAARDEFQQMLTFVNQIINGSASGEDPAFIQFQDSCGGDCGGCSGCS